MIYFHETLGAIASGFWVCAQVCYGTKGLYESDFTHKEA